VATSASGHFQTPPDCLLVFCPETIAKRAPRTFSDSENPVAFHGNHALLTVGYGNLAMPNGHGAAALV